MVTEPPSNDRVVHYGLVGLVLEVAVPAGTELLARPGIHPFQFFFSGSNLHSCFDAAVGVLSKGTIPSRFEDLLCGQWPSSINVPLLEYLLLRSGVSTDKIVKRLNIRLCAVCCECEVMILEVQTNTR